MQRTREAPQRLGPPVRPGRRTTSTIFLPTGGPSPAAASLLLLRAGHIETNPGPYWYACGNPVRHGISPLRCSTANCPILSHENLACSDLHRSNLLIRWQCPTHGGPEPPSRHFPPTPTLLLPGRSGGPSLWDACLSDCICSPWRVDGVTRERLQS